MKNLNVAIEDDVMERAKLAADAEGMLLRKWVERAIVAVADAEDHRRADAAKLKLRESGE